MNRLITRLVHSICFLLLRSHLDHVRFELATVHSEQTYNLKFQQYLKASPCSKDAFIHNQDHAARKLGLVAGINTFCCPTVPDTDGTMMLLTRLPQVPQLHTHTNVLIKHLQT